MHKKHPVTSHASSQRHRISESVRTSPGACSAADWVYLSPPARIEPGERTGHYVLGTDTLLVDDTGASRISAEDFAVMIADQLEAPTPGIRHLTAIAVRTKSDTVEPSFITDVVRRIAWPTTQAPTA